MMFSCWIERSMLESEKIHKKVIRVRVFEEEERFFSSSKRSNRKCMQCLLSNQEVFNELVLMCDGPMFRTASKSCVCVQEIGAMNALRLTVATDGVYILLLFCLFCCVHTSMQPTWYCVLSLAGILLQELYSIHELCLYIHILSAFSKIDRYINREKERIVVLVVHKLLFWCVWQKLVAEFVEHSEWSQPEEWRIYTYTVHETAIEKHNTADA